MGITIQPGIMPFEQLGQSFFVALAKAIPQYIICQGLQSLVLVLKNSVLDLLQVHIFIHYAIVPMPLHPHFPFHSADQLLLDERFLAWAAGKDDTAATEWIESLRRVSEGQEEEVLDALSIYSALHREEIEISGVWEQRDRLLERLERETSPAHSGRASLKSHRRLFQSVGILFVLLLGGWLFFKTQPADRNTLTGQGTAAKLPDGTVVSLRGKSTISYADGLESKDVREVWVKGEAQFEVTHRADHQPFVVHTDAFDVQVTGTRFIVNNDSKEASVLLQEGSVSLLFPGGEVVSMKPGDYFSWSPKSVDPALPAPPVLSNLERHIVFENTPFLQVALEIERRYGVQVEILTPALQDKLITGILPNNDLPVLLRALESAMDCLITQQKQIIYIKTAL